VERTRGARSGRPFPPVAERFERLEEALQIVLQMWSGKRAPYQGKHYQLAETLNSPQPLTQPHPPILIGGSGEKKTLRLVAQYADACNLFAAPDMDVIRHKLDVLKAHCEHLGRDYAMIEKTTLGTAWLAPGHMSAADVIRTLPAAVQHRHPASYLQHAQCPRDCTPGDIWQGDHPGSGRVISLGWPRTGFELAG